MTTDPTALNRKPKVSRRPSMPFAPGAHASVFCRCGAQWHGRWIFSPWARWHRTQHGEPVTEARFRASGFWVRKPAAWAQDARLTRRGHEAEP